MDKLKRLTDEELLREMVLDNHQAFTELYHRYKDVLFQFITRLSHGNYTLAEEVIQQLFILLWTKRKDIIIERSFQSYLKVMSRNLFLKETSRKINEELMVSQVNITKEERKEESYIYDEIELNMLLEEIERIISLLPPARQNVYRLKHKEHLSQKEIANKLGISENTVESHLRQSTKFLRAMLKASWTSAMNGIILLFSSIITLLF